MIVEALYYILPAYLANMAPVLLKNQMPSLNKPIDSGRTWRGKRILGSHKTWRGLMGGAVVGMLTFWVQKLLYGLTFFEVISLIDYPSHTILLGFLLGFGALVGDSVKSFFKRRVGIRPGKPWPIFDQLDFIVGALLFSAPIFLPTWKQVAVIVIVTPILHIAVNHLGYYLKLQKTKW